MDYEMTLIDIKKELLDIEKNASDSEVAHCLEDGLFWWFLRHVAESGPPDLQEKARLILTVDDIEFPRVCA